MPTLLLDRNTVKALMKMSDVINVVEEAFGMRDEGKGKMPARIYLAVDKGDFRAMPVASPGCEGVKMGKRTPRKSISWSTFDAESGGNQ